MNAWYRGQACGGHLVHLRRKATARVIRSFDKPVAHDSDDELAAKIVAPGAQTAV